MIYRVEKTIRDLIQIHKYPILDDSRLSWKAKGILTYLLGHGDNWTWQEEDLLKVANDGAGSIKSGIKELRECGYIEKRPVRKDGKIVRWESVIREIPASVVMKWGNPVVLENSPENQKVEKPEGGKTRRWKNQKVENVPSGEGDSTPEEPPEIKEVHQKVRFPHSGNLTPLLILNKDIKKIDQVCSSTEGEEERADALPPSPSPKPVSRLSRKKQTAKTEPDAQEQPFGEFQRVFLTPDEHQHLLTYFDGNEQERDFWIAELDEYLEAHPDMRFGGSAKAYARHYLTIRNWHRRTPDKWQKFKQAHQARAMPHPVYKSATPKTNANYQILQSW